MTNHRLMFFAVLIFVLTLLPASSYANEAGVGSSTGAGQVNNIMNMPGHDMSGHTMETTVSNITGHDTTDSSTGDMPDHKMNGTGHEVPAEQPAHDMTNMPDNSSGAVQDSSSHQAAGHGGSLNPNAKEVNRAGLLGGFGLVNGFIVLAAIILKRKTKVGGPV